MLAKGKAHSIHIPAFLNRSMQCFLTVSVATVQAIGRTFSARITSISSELPSISRTSTATFYAHSRDNGPPANRSIYMRMCSRPPTPPALRIPETIQRSAIFPLSLKYMCFLHPRSVLWNIHLILLPRWVAPRNSPFELHHA